MSLFRLIVRAVRAHARLAPGLIVLWGLALVGAVALPVAGAVLLGAVVGAVPDGTAALATPFVALAAVEAAYVPCRVYGWALGWAMGRRYRVEHRQRILRALLDPPGIAHMYAPGTLDAATAADNVWAVNILDGVFNVVAARLSGALALVVVGSADPIAALLLFVAWTAMGVWRWRRVRESWKVLTGQQDQLRRARAMSDLALAPAAAKEIRLFGLGAWIGVRYNAEWLRAMADIWRERRTAARGATTVTAVLLGSHLVALVLLARGAARGEIALGTLAAALQGVILARELGEGVMGQWEVDYGLPLIEQVDHLEHAVAGRAEPLPGVASPHPPRRAVRFEGVVFRYPGADRDVLLGFDLEIPVGSSLAIVGENGAGKTTAVQLLARLRDPTGGRITVDGTDLRDWDPSQWHEMVAAVSQESIRLPLSVADNVGAGRTDDRALLARAADDAGILDLVERLPRGWDTPLAKGFTDGTDLSGGQWQRLALARGLVALETGATLLVLDEPTAHLDVRAEADLYDRFLELTRGRTTVLVSHRFSTVRRADRIVVVEGGRVVESGTHDDLVAEGGRYARLFEVQAARFRSEAP